jgi:molecular chaperone HtpG
MPKETKKEKFEFGVEIKKILKLMIHSLYTNKDVAVRELISNASDACDKLRYKSNLDDSLLGDDKDLKIQIEIDEKNRTLSIIDNGIGMDKSELISQLGTIAKSGTEAFLKNLSTDDNKNMQLIGQFGVGFYSAFMIADKVTVISKKVGKKKVNVWTSKGEGSYTIEEAKKDYPRGTRITLHLKEGENEFLDKFHIEHVVKVYSDHIDLPVELIWEKGKVRVVNTGSALWTRPKNEITKEQYQEFYKHVSHMPGEPYMILHNKAEGLIEFTNLLFIPDRRPFDLFHPDRMVRIKLYVKKVFITEDAIKLLPRYLRFVQGIVDSADLPLNISRESLQYNNMITKINRALTKRVLNEDL